MEHVWGGGGAVPSFGHQLCNKIKQKITPTFFHNNHPKHVGMTKAKTLPCIRTFGVPGTRLDARRVSKARLISHTSVNTEMVDHHISISMQDY